MSEESSPIPQIDRDMARFLKPSLGLLLTLYVMALLPRTIADPDLWGYLAFGRLFWEGAGFPYKDVFAYAPTKDMWVYHEWLTGVLFNPLYEHVGMWSLQLVRYLLGLATAGTIYVTARTRGASSQASAIALFFASFMFILGFNPVRAQVFTYFFFALYLLGLSRASREQSFWGLWWLVPLMMVWANLHGGFVAGMGLIGVYALGEALCRRRFAPYLIVLALCGAATLINPYGLEYWRYIIHAVGMPRPEISEWHSVWRAFQTGSPVDNYLIFLVLVFISGLFLIWRPRKNLTELAVMTVMAYLGLKHIRHQIFFFLVFGAFLPTSFDSLGSRLSGLKEKIAARRHLYVGLTLAVSLVLSVFLGYKTISATPWELEAKPRQRVAPISFYYPTGALAYIQTQGLKGRILTLFAWGEYFLFHCYPQCLVGMDGRYETVYPDDYCLEYFKFQKARPGWRQFLKKYPPDMIVLEPAGKITKLLEKESGWHKVYEDDSCFLFLRQGFGK
ncbi:MAG: hypothetical protein PVG03_16685 [Desulfarculaceae bacterium]